jgi:hypothetical protein
VIELEQFKNLNWEPGLISKIMGLNDDPITAKKLSEIQICNTTPQVLSKGLSKDAYEYAIIPRNGGIGAVQVFVNGKLIREIVPGTLPKLDKGYRLSIKQEEIQPYFSAGTANRVVVKATTLNGSMTSRGGVVETAVVGKKATNPDIYIVSIGINAYKGSELKLNYASTDAESFASALDASAKKPVELRWQTACKYFHFQHGREKP